MPKRGKVTKTILNKWTISVKIGVANLDLFDLEKWPLERFNQILFWVVDQYHPWEGSGQNREKFTDQFLRKCSKVQKRAQFLPLKNLYSDSTKSFLWYVVNVIPKKPKKRKCYWSLSEIGPSPLKVDAATAAPRRRWRTNRQLKNSAATWHNEANNLGVGHLYCKWCILNTFRPSTKSWNFTHF